MQATLSSKGQLVIPAQMRRSLRLGKRSKVEIEERDGAVIIRPAKKRPAAAKLPRIKPFPPGSIKLTDRDYALDRLAGPDYGPEE